MTSPDEGDSVTTWDVFPLHQEDPAWSRQGPIAYRDNGIVCVDAHGGYFTDPALAGLWVLDPGTGARRRLLPFGYSPAWSPDGRRLAFESGAQIFVADSDGSNVQQLTALGRNFYPCWDHDGQRIAFDSDGGSATGPYSIWIMNSDGSVTKAIAIRYQHLPAVATEEKKAANREYLLLGVDPRTTLPVRLEGALREVAV